MLSCVCFLPNEAQAATITVNTTSDTIVANACLNSSTGCTLRGAITLANTTTETDFIEFNIPANDPFCAAGACTINLNSRLPTIGTNMRITGPGADKLTVRNATAAAGAVFHMSMSGPGTVFQIFSLTISGGDTNFGGGLLLVGDSPSVQVRIVDCVIIGNTATAQGGGIFNSHATTAIFNSLITGNTGGGIFNSLGVLTIINSTINGNTGKGIENDAGTVNLTNSTVSSNGGINSNGITNGGSGAVFNVKSSIIARNGGAFFSDISGAFVSAGFNLVGKRDAGTGFITATDLTGTIDVPLDPRFDPGGLKDNGGTTKTITLMSGSPAIDKGSNNSLGGVLLELDQRGSPRRFDDPAVSNASGGDGTDIGALERRKSPYDFDGDGRTDISIFRPPPGEWWYLRSSTGGNGALQFGESTDKITPADFTGDGKTDIAIWRSSNGNWFVLRSEDFSFFGFPFGTAGDVPVPADFDGDGRSDPAVFRPSNATWFISQSSGGGTRILQFGLNSDKPVVADYDNDGRSDVGIVRANGGAMEWWIQRSTDGLLALRFGVATDKAVQGDYTGDGKADVAIWRPSTGEWFILRSENQTLFGFPFGTAGDLVAPGDYDGEGKFDATVFRPSGGLWFSQRSNGGFAIQQFGLNGDRPIPNAFVP